MSSSYSSLATGRTQSSQGRVICPGPESGGAMLLLKWVPLCSHQDCHCLTFAEMLEESERMAGCLSPEFPNSPVRGGVLVPHSTTISNLIALWGRPHQPVCPLMKQRETSAPQLSFLSPIPTTLRVMPPILLNGSGQWIRTVFYGKFLHSQNHWGNAEWNKRRCLFLIHIF